MNKALQKAHDNKILMQKILELLTQNPTGFTVQEITEKIDTTRQAVTKALTMLKVGGSVNREELQWKLDKFITKGKLPYPNFEEEHKQWVKEITSKKTKFNPHERN